MNINDILRTGTNVQLVINALDLKEAFLQWSEEAKSEVKQTQVESYLTSPNIKYIDNQLVTVIKIQMICKCKYKTI